MATILMELRYQSKPGEYERYSGLVDGINDIVLELAGRFDLDVLSLSHMIDNVKNSSIQASSAQPSAN